MMTAPNATMAGEPAMTGARLLDDDMLDAVTGAVDCATGMKLARTYIALSQIASVIGDTSTAAKHGRSRPGRAGRRVRLTRRPASRPP